MAEKLYSSNDQAALERYELAAKATCDLIWDWNIRENTLWWNNNFREWVGVAAADTNQLSAWEERVHPDDMTGLMRDMDVVLASGATTWEGQYRFLRKDGLYAYVHDRGHIVYENGKAVRVVGYMQDITERVQEEKLRHEQEQERSFALEAAEVGTWVFYPLTRQVKWDARCKKLFGFSKADIVSFDLVMQYIHEEDVLAVNASIQAALDPINGGDYDIQFRTVGAEDKILRWLHCKGKTYFNKEGVAYRFAGTAQDITEQVAAREKVASVERIAKLAVERSGVGTFYVDMRTQQVTYSSLGARILTGSEVLHMSRDKLIQHVHPDDRSLRDQAYEKADETGYVQYDSRFIWDDGSVHAARVIGMYGYNALGAVVDFYGIIQDITPEMESRREQRKLLSLVENSENCKAVSDAGGTIIYMNNAGKKLTGVHLDGSMPPIHMHQFFAEDHPVFTEESWSGYMIFKHLQNGERITCHAEIRRIYDGVTFIGWGATLRDLRPELAARRVLEESERRFKTLVMACPVPIAVYIGRELRIELVNQALLNTWEKDSSVVGKTFLQALPEMEGQPFVHILQQVFDTGKVYEAREQMVYLMRKGILSPTYYHFTYTPLLDEQGKVYGIMNTAVEITDVVQAKMILAEAEVRLELQVHDRTQELQAATEELQATMEELQSTNEELITTNEELNEANLLLNRSNKELEQYAFVASHDLQEPLRKIRLYAGMMHNNSNVPDDAKTMLGKIMHSGERMSILIRDLLEFSRLLRNERTLGVVDLNTILLNILSDFEMIIQEKQAVVTYNDLPAVEAEPLQMNQLIFNLVGNALKFTRKEASPHINIAARELSREEVAGHIDVKRQDIRYYAISVADNGIGFDARYADQIFEVFKRLHTRESYPGSGIGLALCRKIVQNHNGWLEVQSEEGVGTTITFVLPETQTDSVLPA
ncbi:PAS domain S-box-containing protein [Filimonas lacunae]|uniref:histidine kinase n=1 Tax=Filimonas lacunae TaxID=477680 RepID=A0A173MF06_9BACT|nr:PAS domain-containing protein [Filimonas lacunae]BAV06097.1 phytochrome, two-component sensor histidine kinase [Filimonas lacunae]SIT24641.1 PAS domain S-box-containing protein [Filimonas lacunae]